MMELFALKLCTAYSHARANFDRLKRQEMEDPSTPISQQYVHYLMTTSVLPLIEQIDAIKLDDELLYRCKRFQVLLGRPHAKWTAESLLNAVDNFLVDIVRALGRKRFAYIPPANDKLFGQQMPFGKAVYDAMPAAQQDVRDAADCLAFELHTACVFHLMRAAEHGLRKLARELKIKVLYKAKPCPLEDADWQALYDAIKKKLEHAHRLASKPKKRAQLSLYSDLADHCLFMRDIWRNDVSHCRKPYNQDEAQAAWSRVERFMQLIAESKK